MSPQFSLPYLAPDGELPAPLPSREDIVTSKVCLKDSASGRVVRVGKHYAVKYGPLVSLTEGESMLFVAAESRVPVPKVYALFHADHPRDGRVNFIVMEFVEGETLESKWCSLKPQTKATIAEQLRAAMDDLRRLPSPGYFGRVGSKPFEDAIFWTSAEDNVPPDLICGPFDSEAGLNNALVEKYLYNGGSQNKAEFYRRTLPQVFRGHRPVFSHNDLQPKNLILNRDGAVTVIDWEASGWYPDYWEYAMAHIGCGGWKSDWHQYLARILDGYPNEYAWVALLWQELWN